MMANRLSQGVSTLIPAAVRLLVFLLMSSLLLPAAGAQQRSAGELESVTLQLKWKHQFQFAGYYAAIEKGYYRDADLQVRLREPLEDEEPANVVLSGAAQYGISTSDLVRLRSQGQPFVVLAPIFQHSPFVFLATERSGVSSIRDLKGKPLMIEPHAAELIAYLRWEGIPQDQFSLVGHKFEPAPLIDGQVYAMSAYSTDEPYLLEAAGVKYMTFTPRAAGIDFYGDTLFTTERQIAEHPDQVRRFLEASRKGWQYALEHAEELVDIILTKYSTRHGREHLLFEAEMSRKLILPDVVEIGYTNPGRWRHIADTYSELGLMPPNASLDGFLYQTPAPSLTKFYAAFTLALLVITALAAVAVRFARMNAQIKRQALSLAQALSEIKVLKGILPICSHCKSIRDDQGYWKEVESYLAERTDAEFSHAICANCLQKYYPDYQDHTV